MGNSYNQLTEDDIQEFFRKQELIDKSPIVSILGPDSATEVISKLIWDSDMSGPIPLCPASLYFNTDDWNKDVGQEFYKDGWNSILADYESNN